MRGESCCSDRGSGARGYNRQVTRSGGGLGRGGVADCRVEGWWWLGQVRHCHTQATAAAQHLLLSLGSAGGGGQVPLGPAMFLLVLVSRGRPTNTGLSVGVKRQRGAPRQTCMNHDLTPAKGVVVDDLDIFGFLDQTSKLHTATRHWRLTTAWCITTGIRAALLSAVSSFGRVEGVTLSFSLHFPVGVSRRAKQG